MKVSEKAKELIGDFSTATEQTALNPTVAAFNLYCAAREDLEDYIAELEAALEGRDPFEDFPPKARGLECSVMVLGKFEYEDEFTPFTNWDLCVYWFDEERWHPLNGYVKGDDIVRWYALPYEEREE